MKPSVLVALALAAAALPACSSLDKPALPRRARIETADSRIPVDELRQVVDGADILYLPADQLSSDEQSGAALRLLSLLQQSTARSAVAWATIAVDLQPHFQEWNGGRMALDQLIDGIRFASERQRDAARRLLRELHERNFSAIPIACGTTLSCTAENVAREFDALAGGKLLVIIDRRDVEATSGVPSFVAQRVKARQVVFDVHAKVNPLLVSSSAGAGEIVDAAPRAGRDRR